VFVRGPYRDVTSKGQSQVLESSVQGAVEIVPERVKLKNLHC
jgi:hypothetical protein